MMWQKQYPTFMVDYKAMTEEERPQGIVCD